jgi:capsular exopolysaccharide synthesis family protein
MSNEKPIHVPRADYPQAMYPQSISGTATAEFEQQEDGIHILDYWRVLVARRWTILAIFLTVVTVSLIYTFKQTPIYQATASIQIDKENPNVLSFKDVYEIETATDDTLRTQFEVLKSRSLARRVILDLKLDTVEEFVPKYSGVFGAIAGYIRDIFPPTNVRDKEEARLRPIIDRYIERLNVTPVRQARLVNISFESKDPELAARIINSHAKNFIDQNLRFKVEATEAASDFLQENLVQLKQKLEKAEDQLQQYSQRNQILFTEEGKNTATEKLRQLEEGYTKAQEDRIEKESYQRLIDSGHSDALPQLVDNKLIADLTSKLVDLQRQDSELSVTFRPDYPLRQKISGQIDQIRRSIETENGRVVTTVRSEYSAALDREQLLNAELQKQRDVVNKINEDIIQYNIYKGDADSVRQLYDGLQRRLKEASVSAGLTASNIRIVDRAEIPPFPVRPQKALNTVLSIVVGLSFGIALAFVQEHLDNSIKTPEDVTRYLNVPTLGLIPRLGSLIGKAGYGYGNYGYGAEGYGVRKTLPANEALDARSVNVDLVVHNSPSSLMAEAYRSLRTSLLISSSGHPPKTIVVTSAAPSEGKTTTAVNLAISLTQTGAKVVLIDADMRKPRIQTVLSLEHSTGLSSFLAGTAQLRDVIQKTNVPGLLAIPCGVAPPNPGELILSTGFRKMLEALREYFDFIILDSPPVCNVSDARIIGAAAESVILVVRAFSTSRHYAREAVSHLSNAHARVGGVVLNDVDVRRHSYYSGYSYYGSSGYSGYGHNSESGQSASV